MEEERNEIDNWFEEGIGYWRTHTRWIECCTMSQHLFALSVWIDSARDCFFCQKENPLHLPADGWIVRTAKIELLREQIISFNKPILIKTWFSHVGKTSLQLEHEVIDEEQNQIYARFSGVIVLIDQSSNTKKEISNPEQIKSLIRPQLIQISNDIPPRSLSSNCFTYRFKTRPSDIDSFQHINNGRYLEFIEDAKSIAGKILQLGEIGNSFILNDLCKLYIEYNLPAFIEDLVMFLWNIEENIFGLELCRVNEKEEVIQVLSRMKFETRMKASKL